MPQIRSLSILVSGMYTNTSQSNQIIYGIAFYRFVGVVGNRWVGRFTLPTADILSGKNVRAWVSMDFT